MSNQQKILIVGYGDIGRRVAKHYTEQGIGIVAACRQSPCDEIGIEHLAVDLDTNFETLAEWLKANPKADVYWFAPPQKNGTQDLRIRAACQHLANSSIRRLVYISTTAVYGDCHGRWIDEKEPLKPETDRGRRRQNAEQCLQEAGIKNKFELAVLRVPGIYGPGRWPLARLKKGLPVLREDESPYTNRIHQDDLASIAIAAMNNAPIKSGQWQAYNVSDGQPSTMTDYFNQIADAFNLPRPPQVSRAEAEQQLTSAMLSFMNESKRLINSRLFAEFKIELIYSSLSEGLANSCGSTELE